MASLTCFQIRSFRTQNVLKLMPAGCRVRDDWLDRLKLWRAKNSELNSFWRHGTGAGPGLAEQRTDQAVIGSMQGLAYV